MNYKQGEVITLPVSSATEQVGELIDEHLNGVGQNHWDRPQSAVLDGELREASLEVIGVLFLQYSPSGTGIVTASTVLECRGILLRLAVLETELTAQEMQAQMIELYGTKVLETLRLYVMAVESILVDVVLDPPERQHLEDFILSTIINRQII